MCLEKHNEKNARNLAPVSTPEMSKKRNWRPGRSHSATAAISRSLVCGLLFTGCSPYGFAPEIASFSSSIASLKTADKTGKSQLDAERQEQDILAWTARADGSLRVIDCVATGSKCRIVSSEQTKDEKERIKNRLMVDKARAKAAGSLNALVFYSEGLEAIANADDATELVAAQDRFNGAIASSFQTIGVQAAETKLGPILSFVAKLTTTTLNRARFRALRDATETGHDNVVELADKLGIELNRIRNARIQELRGQTLQLNQSMSLLAECGNIVTCRDVHTIDIYGLYGGHLAALAAVTQRIAKLQTQDGEAVSASMVRTHGKLREAVSDAANDPTEVFAAISEFAELAQGIVDAFKS